MVSRSPRLALAAAALAALLIGACQRVPLLAPSGSTITLTSSTTVLAINGATDLIAQVLESAGTPPHTGTRVSFTTTLGSVQPAEADTDISGRVIVRFLAGTSSGTATITAFSGGAGGAAPATTGGDAAATAPLANTVRIAIGAAAVAAVSVSALPTTVSNLGGPSTITANVRDTNGNVLPGVPVAFTTDNGSLSAAVANTDQSGNAQTVLTTSKISKVTATAGVASGSGTTATTGQTGTVTINVNVVATLKIDPPSPASPSVGQSVTFPFTYTIDTTNSAPVQSVTVDFGNGSKTTLAGKPSGASHTYAAVGSYSIRATLTDALGDTSTASGSVIVAPLASVTIGKPSPESPVVGQAVSFPLTYSRTGGDNPAPTGSPIVRLVVDFGDGTAAVNYAGAPGGINHTYRSIGTFAVQVTAFDSFGNQSNGSGSVTVGPLAAPTIGAPSPPAPFAGQTVTFPITYATGSTSSIQRVVADFGDGSGQVPSNGAPGSVSHRYNSSGTFGVQVTIFDAFGNSASGSASVFVTATPQPVVLISAPSTTPTVGTDTTFTLSVTPGTGSGAVITEVNIEFGEGQSSHLGAVTGTGIPIHHVYATSGTFTVTATARDSNGTTGRGATTVFVQAQTPLTVFLSAVPTFGTTQTTETFTATVVGLGNAVVVNYQWDFGDGRSASTSGNAVTQTYSHPSGPFTVRVTILTSTGLTASGTTVINP